MAWLVKGLMCKPEDTCFICRILKSRAGLHVHVLLVPGRSRQQVPVIRCSASLAYLRALQTSQRPREGEMEEEEWRDREKDDV